MHLERLDIEHVRNIASAHLQLGPGVVLITGPNGSGKTSLLEAIYVLGTARTFRSNHIDPMINYHRQVATVFGSVCDHVRGGPSQDAELLRASPVALGVSKSRQGETRIRVDGEYARSASLLASIFPIQLVNPDTIAMVTGSPGLRRRFMDWGVFHVEPRFHAAWRELRRGVRQRNALLRSRSRDDALFEVWEHAIGEAAVEVDRARGRFIEVLIQRLPPWLSALTDMEAPELRYQRGWPRDRALPETLREQRSRDREYGYTRSGPHRANLRVVRNGSDVGDTLSRGEQKLLACGLLVAQGAMLQQAVGRRCVYLVDDLAAELDGEHRRRMGAALVALDAQVIATAVEAGLIRDGFAEADSLEMFHVEHGSVRRGAAVRE